MLASSIVHQRKEVAAEETCDESCWEKKHAQRRDSHHSCPVLTCFECNRRALLGDTFAFRGDLEVDFAIAVGEEIVRLCSKI